jgi:hypothetical protein
MGGPPSKIFKEETGLSRTPALLLTPSLALASRVGREMLNEHLGVVLKNMMRSA